MNCNHCGRELPAKKPGGRRQREYCNNACKQAHYRQLHQTQPEASREELVALERQLEEAQERIEELEQEVSGLRQTLAIEQRYHEDTKAYNFKSWLKKQPTTPFRKRFLADEIILPRGSRGMYQAQLRRLQYSAEEMQEFTDLWKLMLLQS